MIVTLADLIAVLGIAAAVGTTVFGAVIAFGLKVTGDLSRHATALEGLGVRMAESIEHLAERLELEARARRAGDDALSQALDGLRKGQDDR